MDAFERVLFYKDLNADEFKKADKMRQLLYKEVVDLGNKFGYSSIDRVRALNDAFYLCARIYAGDIRIWQIFEKVICYEGPELVLGNEVPDSSKLTFAFVDIILSLQQSLPLHMVSFLRIFKDVISQYQTFEYAEQKVKEWRKQYGVFKTDIAPNPSISLLLWWMHRGNICLYFGPSQVAEEILKKNLLFLYSNFIRDEIESRIRLFRNKNDQMIFVDKTFNQYYKYVLEWPVNPNDITHDDIKQEYMNRIEAGVYLPHYDFSVDAIPLPKETDAAEDEDDAEALRKQCEHYLANLKKREEEIERMKKEMEELKKKLAEGQKTDDSKLKQTLIEELAQVADDKEELVPLELLVSRLEDAGFRNVCSVIIKKRKRELRKEEVRVSQTITQSNVFNGDVNDPTFK